jgi:hypothetical protein
MAGPKLNELKSQQKALEAERADLPVEQEAVALHPTALQHYEMLVTDLQSVFGEGLTEANEEAAERIRNLVVKVTVGPADDGFSIKLQGRLALLMGAPDLYPSMRLAASGGSMVAEERYHQCHHVVFHRKWPFCSTWRETSADTQIAASGALVAAFAIARKRSEMAVPTEVLR